MYAYFSIPSFFQQVGDIMNMMKNMALMAMGGMIGMAYMKYKKPVTDMMQKAFKETKQMANEMLEDMM